MRACGNAPCMAVSASVRRSQEGADPSTQCLDGASETLPAPALHPLRAQRQSCRSVTRSLHSGLPGKLDDSRPERTRIGWWSSAIGPKFNYARGRPRSAFAEALAGRCPCRSSTLWTTRQAESPPRECSRTLLEGLCEWYPGASGCFLIGRSAQSIVDRRGVLRGQIDVRRFRKPHENFVRGFLNSAVWPMEFTRGGTGNLHQ